MAKFKEVCLTCHVLFNSLAFGWFLVLVFCLYWWMGRWKHALKAQNVLLLVSSYIFYGSWDWRFLGLILLSSLIDFWAGGQIAKSEGKSGKKGWLMLSLAANLGMLGIFKYLGFFVSSFQDLLQLIGIHSDPWTLKIILPVGISFYTFQTLSYSIDIYRGKLAPSKDLLSFLCFVSFFPQLVAGPIERAADLLPQFTVKRQFEYHKAVQGLRQILWGLFKKIVVADNLAILVNFVFAKDHEPSQLEAWWGMLAFTFQVYCDFSGYSDIAIGTAALFGFRLKANFRQPLLSTGIQEFWNRWHISLSSWFRDYVYIPLGGNRHGEKRTSLNLFLTFLVSGIWHGADYTYVFFGGVHGLGTVFERTVARRKKLPIWGWFPSFAFVALSFILFRSTSLSQAIGLYAALFGNPTRSFEGIETDWLQVLPMNGWLMLMAGIIVFMVLHEYLLNFGEAAPQFDRWPRVLRWTWYYLIIAAIWAFGAYGIPQQFIYFQF